MIASISGVRGILNDDMSLEMLAGYCGNFAHLVRAPEMLLARDTRKTGPVIARSAAAAMMAQGVRVFDCGVVSTPALFRESRLSGRPGVMVTASHNEPQFNGLKFVVEGRGIGKDAFDSVVNGHKGSGRQFGAGSLRALAKTAYAEDLVGRFGAGSCDGIRVAMDLGGGAAISHSFQILRRLGCDVVSVNDSYGVFNRKVDPVADELSLLRNLVKERDCDVGLGFDCDGDRLVVVDPQGRKRTGDYMLTLALSEMLTGTPEKTVVVSLDTTQAIDDVVTKAGGRVLRSKVGEANVVGMMLEKGARLGGEGSSGGLIEGSFNYCRDSMLAALVIIRALKARGRRIYDSVPVYHQERVALALPRAKALRGIMKMAGKYDEADSTDGLKVRLSKRSWVLLRPSGTEDAVRVSAEAESQAKAVEITRSFAAKLKELSR